MHKSDVLRIIFKHLHELYTLNLPFRLKGTYKIHTKGLFKFHSNIYSILFVENTCVLTLTMHSDNTCALCPYTHNTLRQYMCTVSLYSQYTQAIHVYCVFILTIHSDNTCALCLYAVQKLRHVFCVLILTITEQRI